MKKEKKSASGSLLLFWGDPARYDKPMENVSGQVFVYTSIFDKVWGSKQVRQPQHNSTVTCCTHFSWRQTIHKSITMKSYTEGGRISSNFLIDYTKNQTVEVVFKGTKYYRKDIKIFMDLGMLEEDIYMIYKEKKAREWFVVMTSVKKQ